MAIYALLAMEATKKEAEVEAKMRVGANIEEVK